MYRQFMMHGQRNIKLCEPITSQAEITILFVTVLIILWWEIRIYSHDLQNYGLRNEQLALKLFFIFNLL